MKALVADGFHPNGKSRSWVQVEILRKTGRFYLVKNDKGVTYSVPCYAVRYIPATIN